MNLAALNSLSIHRLVSILSGLGIGAVMLLGGLSYLTYQSLDTRTQVATEAQAQARQAAELDHTLSVAKLAEAPIWRSTDATQIQAGIDKVGRAHQQYAEGLTPIAQSLGAWPVQQQQVQTLQREQGLYAQAALAVLKRWQQAPTDATRTQLQPELERLEAQFSRLDEHNQIFQGAIHARSQEALEAAQGHLSQTRWVVLVVAALVAVGLFMVSLVIVKAILRPIKALSQLIENSHNSGTFEANLETPVAGEVGHMVSCYQQFMHTIHEAMQEAIAVSQASAKGHFQVRMQGQYSGDLAALKTGINASADGVHGTSTALGDIMQALSHGDFSRRLSNEVPQATRDQVNQALDVLCGALDEVDEVLNALSHGDFSQRVRSQLPGRLKELKDNINSAMDETDVAMLDATHVMEQLASGNLHASDDREHPGRFGDLMKAVNATVGKLRATMQGIIQTSELVSNTSDKITLSSHELSDTAQAQLSSVQEIEPALERMGEGAKKKLAFTEQANQLVLQATTQAHDGSSVVQEATEAMEALNEASKRIADITGIIDGIASQTNLLALNASVEAARAGEQGRGFAVVATEVGHLAQRSANSAREIKSLIEDSVGKVHSSTQLVDRTGEQLQEILQSVGQVKSTMGHIVEEEKKQSHDIQHIRELVDHVMTSSDKNSDCCTRVSKASDKMKSEADVLRKDIQYFTL